jgi:hypothetical protein
MITRKPQEDIFMTQNGEDYLQTYLMVKKEIMTEF